ncbi:MAG: RNA polymerase sigma-70 factor [Saprospiraceae bacterium]|nr:RNA polymerase sigma-70 factor [Bacteroidia bacterium]NNF23143.1 RNA polymerase sigma-70 factor [Saprospiraceae bacterium]NNK89139.1 RNA polymerase sigma-70 factor [Saprospiraceae bacterium]
MNYTDQELVDLFYEDNTRGFELVFKQYYPVLCQTAVRITKEASLAEDIVQEVFFELFRKKDNVKIQSLIGYLKRSVYNRALNKVKSSRDFVDTDEMNLEIRDESHSSHDQLEYGELENFINDIIDTLPEKCRLVFVLNRFEQLSYKEVAERMDISVKTVENQMSKALRILRAQYSKYEDFLKNEETG